MNAPLNHTVTEMAGKQELLLASMRCASANLRTWQIEIESCGIALKNGAITLDDACEWMNDCGLLAYLSVPEQGQAQ